MGVPPEPPDEQPPPPPPPDAEGGLCPRCGTPYEPFQEYCLECGLRLPVQRGIIPVLSTAWRRRLPWYPGDWIWPVLGLLIVAALGAAIGILATTGSDGSATKTRAETQATVPLGTGTGATSPPPPAETSTSTLPTESVPTTAPEPPPPPPPSNQLTAWPAGQNGWTIVLASIPQSAGRAAAVSEARKALNAGLTDVGVLNSSEFSSLHSGYFVVFSGTYNSESEAKSALDTAKGSYAQAYVRQIVR
ncbi:MAG TPA: zinc ribbon domain-containing protein [Gaiellaceae bacterium]